MNERYKIFGERWRILGEYLLRSYIKKKKDGDTTHRQEKSAKNNTDQPRGMDCEVVFETPFLWINVSPRRAGTYDGSDRGVDYRRMSDKNDDDSDKYDEDRYDVWSMRMTRDDSDARTKMWKLTLTLAVCINYWRKWNCSRSANDKPPQLIDVKRHVLANFPRIDNCFRVHTLANILTFASRSTVAKASVQYWKYLKTISNILMEKKEEKPQKNVERVSL